ncbi:MAG: DUF6788 family protein [Acidimicrobiales bacterium]
MAVSDGGIAGRLFGVEPTPAQRREIDRITDELATLGPCLPGTVITRLGPCGKAACSCKADPPKLHGPYRSWTRKISAKTVTRLLTEEQLEDYQPWLDNAKRLRALVAQLEALTMAMVEADPRWRPPDPVDKTRSARR